MIIVLLIMCAILFMLVGAVIRVRDEVYELVSVMKDIRRILGTTRLS